MNTKEISHDKPNKTHKRNQHVHENYIKIQSLKRVSPNGYSPKLLFQSNTTQIFKTNIFFFLNNYKLNKQNQSCSPPLRFEKRDKKHSQSQIDSH